MNPKRGLGKGLQALIPQKIAAEEKREGILSLKLSRILPNRFQPRVKIKPESLKELTHSIKEKGILEPLLVRQTDSGYELIAGERRLEAAKLAGLKEVPTLVLKASEEEALELSLIENLQRENLNPLEEAKAYQRLSQEFNLTQAQIAERVGKERSTIANSLRLLSLPVEIQRLLEEEKITAGHARTILSLTERRDQLELGQRIAQRGLSVREAEEWTKRKAEGRRQKAEGRIKKDPHITLVEESLQRVLGTKVRLYPKGKRGRIEIEYYSPEDLERLLNILKVKY
ncbi:MAG: ParB/RepB/Spo0J family partition protein [Candidatus Edwardsbacteria bacterium]